MPTLICPTCQRKVPYEDKAELPYLPFCSERCRLVDLGKWFTEQYRVITPAEPSQTKERPPGDSAG